MAVIHRDPEGRAVQGIVFGRHRADLELVEARRDGRDADETARMLGQEVDVLGRDALGRQHHVAFVLAFLVVDDDHEAAGADLFDRLVDAVEIGHEPLLPKARCSASQPSPDDAAACGRVCPDSGSRSPASRLPSQCAT
jgi:hypothetical protein